MTKRDEFKAFVEDTVTLAANTGWRQERRVKEIMERYDEAVADAYREEQPAGLPQGVRKTGEDL